MENPIPWLPIIQVTGNIVYSAKIQPVTEASQKCKIPSHRSPKDTEQIVEGQRQEITIKTTGPMLPEFTIKKQTQWIWHVQQSTYGERQAKHTLQWIPQEKMRKERHRPDEADIGCNL